MFFIVFYDFARFCTISHDFDDDDFDDDDDHGVVEGESKWRGGRSSRAGHKL